MFMEAETWVALAFVVFVAGLGYIGVHKIIGKSLDDRAARIKADIDEARKLRDEGRTIVFISHRLEEVRALCDRVTIFRDGNKIATDLLYVPLPVAVQNAIRAAWAAQIKG